MLSPPLFFPPDFRSVRDIEGGLHILVLKSFTVSCYMSVFFSRRCCRPALEACTGGLGSSVGIATGYGLDGPRIESRWGARFSAPVQTGPGAHPASCTMGTGSFLWVKSGRGVTLTPHPLPVPRS